MSYPNQVPDEPLAEVGREPLHEAIAVARQDRRHGISIQTLGVAAAASAAASYAASHLWGPGTVASAALTPVIVALVSEFLRRPINKVSATAARVAPATVRPPSPPPVAGREPPPADWTPVSYGPPPPQPGWRPRWRLVLLTGLAAFAIVVGVYTVPDLVLGHSIAGTGGATTFFSSGSQAPTTVQVHVETVTTPAPTPPAASTPTTSTDTTPLAPKTAPQPTTPTTGTAPSTTDTTPSTTDTTPTGTTTVPAPTP